VAQEDEVPKKDAEIMPVGGPKKRSRGRKMKEWTRNQDGCRKRLAVTRKGTSRRAKVARQIKENDRKVSGPTSVGRRNSIRIKDEEGRSEKERGFSMKEERE
jgi:hypothetical protein